MEVLDRRREGRHVCAMDPPLTPLLPVADAVARIVEGVGPLAAETVRLADAAGRVLADPLAARRTQPPFAASAMDGYAVRAADLAAVPARLKLIGTSAAGHGFAGTLHPGETVRISTGAPVPAGADAILIQENAETPDPATVVARETVAVGAHVRPAGLDFRERAALLAAGRLLGMRELGLAAAMGYGTVPVRRRPRVAILSTGDELVPPGTLPGPDQIVSSNAVGIAAFVNATGGAASDLGIAIDDTAAIASAIDAAVALPADVLVTIGGASVGDHDLVQEALAGQRHEARLLADRHAPGQAADVRPDRRDNGDDPLRVLGLPGNPVSSIVCSILFLRPLLDALLGREADRPERAGDARRWHRRQRRAPGLRPRHPAPHARRPAAAYPPAACRIPPCCRRSPPPTAWSSARRTPPRPPPAPPCRIIRLP